jgi:hypothetical protein
MSAWSAAQILLFLRGFKSDWRGTTKSSGVGSRQVNFFHPASFQGFRGAARAGWTGTQRGVSVFTDLMTQSLLLM